MALSLNILADERNDSKQVTIADASTGWGTDTSPDYTEIVSTTGMQEGEYGLTLKITINTPTSSIQYDTIDLYDLHGGAFTTQEDMTFNIDASMLIVNNSALGDSNTLLPDGVWDITYAVVTMTNGYIVDYSTKSDGVLMIGQATKSVYDKLRLVPIYYNSKICKERDIKEAMFYNTFLSAVRKNAYIARRDELLEMLETLQRLLLNGSNYPW